MRRNPINIRLLFFFYKVACSVLLSACNYQQEIKPNVILILADDQGWGDLGWNGNSIIETPQLDKLFNESVTFKRFYVEPTCAPTRASLLTGRYHLRTGVSWVAQGYENMRTEEYTLAEMFKDNGYVTGCFGKWHNGAHFPQSPNGQGFDEFIGFCGGWFPNYFDPILEENGKPYPAKGYITDILTDETIRFIDANKNKPFFAYVPFNAPHEPYQIDTALFLKYYQKLDGMEYEKERKRTASVYGMIENMDWNIGKIRKYLIENRLDSNTIILFLSDNGPYGERYNGGMKGKKSDPYEGGTRVPFSIYWKGKFDAGYIINELGAHIDILPTLAKLCNFELSDNIQLDGIDLTPLLLKKCKNWPDRMIYTYKHGPYQKGEKGAIRNKKFAMVKYPDKDPELYNLENDYGQKLNLASSDNPLTDSLYQIYENGLQNQVRHYYDAIQINLGYDSSSPVNLLANEAKLSAGLNFYGKNGFDFDWIINWNLMTDTICWKINAIASKEYNVYFRYTCPAKDIGSIVLISSASDTIEGTIDEAYDPEAFTNVDWVPRTGVYVKPFLKKFIGKLDIKEGMQEISVYAKTIKRTEVAEFSGLILEEEEYFENK